ncbi:MAG: hypothetical protein EOO73_08120 [Myxococcales bacterium]|nr:MAG: hypothetical protein EOO73_08120 [Myxococcales bacterium]
MVPEPEAMGGLAFVPLRDQSFSPRQERVHSRSVLKKKLILGDEHDDALRQSLMACLSALGADVAARQWGLGGSQTLETMRVYLGKDLVVVEAETYVGLSIQGEARVVNRVADALAGRSGGGSASEGAGAQRTRGA